jgi:hypothetical protein
MGLNAAAIRALKAAGVSDSQILDAFIKADEERMARAREGNRVRQAAHRARNANNAVTPVTDVTESEQKKGPPDPLKENISPKEKPPKGGQKKGARLPDDWQPSPADRDYGAKLGFSISEMDGMAEDLRLWASAAAGPAAIKRDWGSAFKGWMRREARKRPQNGGTSRAMRQSGQTCLRSSNPIPGSIRPAITTAVGISLNRISPRNTQPNNQGGQNGETRKAT